MKKLLFVVLAVCLLCCAGVVMSHAAVDITEEIEDLNFRAAVYEEIGKVAPAPIYDTDVEGIWDLDVRGMDIQSLAGLDRFTSLKSLYCNGNQLTTLPDLPQSLNLLFCGFNELTELPSLPLGLTRLDCDTNHLSSLPTLPSTLRILSCENNRLTELPELSHTVLVDFRCGIYPVDGNFPSYNQITVMPELPLTLELLECYDNQLTSLPTLPPGLTMLFCAGNKLTALPDLPLGLKKLWCAENQLSSLPALHSSLTELACSQNRLTSIDVTGLGLELLWCQYNNMPSKSAVIGFTGAWDGEYFVFDPQNSTTQPPAPDKGIFGTNPKWSGAWWHYLLFFFCFGFIWMWF